MPTYTNLLQSQFQEISPYDENFTEELLSIAQLFRPFSDAMDEFLLEHGYAGNIDDVEAKVAFIRKTFEQASMTPPRETRLWFTENSLSSGIRLFSFALRSDWTVARRMNSSAGLSHGSAALTVTK